MSDRLTDAELDAALEHMQSMLSVRGTAIVAELRERREAERRQAADLSTAERNARAALARDPKECVAITAEEACALFDRVHEQEAQIEYLRVHAVADETAGLIAEARAESEAWARHSSEVEARLTDLRKRLDILRAVYEAETGKKCSL